MERGRRRFGRGPALPPAPDQYRELTAGESANVARNELLAGQEAFRRDDWSAAQGHFERALQLDSAFAQAAWHLALAALARAIVRGRARALHERYGPRLPPLQALLARAQLEPDLPMRFALFEDALRRYPRRGEAALLYADELVHRGPMAGIPLDSGLAMMQTAAPRTVLDRPRAPVVGFARTGDKARADTALRLLDAAGATSGDEAMRAAGSSTCDRNASSRGAAVKLRYIAGPPTRSPAMPSAATYGSATCSTSPTARSDSDNAGREG